MKPKMTEADCTHRIELYRRKLDGHTVMCGDWTDGTTSWVITPTPPIHWAGNIVGTMTTADFDDTHEIQAP